MRLRPRIGDRGPPHLDYRCAELRAALGEAERDQDRGRGILRVCSVVTELLGPLGRIPILVGGAAVEFYTAGRYRTGDFDFLAPDHPRLEETLGEVGFRKSGHSYVLAELDLWVEFPGSSPEPGLEVVTTSFEGRAVTLISAVDILLDRLRAFVYWGSVGDGASALLLLATTAPILARSTIEAKAASEPLLLRVLPGVFGLADRLGEDPGLDLKLELRRILDGH